MTAQPCRGRARHWRVLRGTVGMRAPVCVVCGSPNPRPLTDQEWADLTDWAEHYNVGRHVRAAIEARNPQQVATHDQEPPGTLAVDQATPGPTADRRGRPDANRRVTPHDR